MSEEIPTTRRPSAAREPLDMARLETLRELQDATDSDFLSELIDVYRDDTPQRLAGLREAVAGGDAAAAERFAHSVKGSSSNIGAQLVEALAAELENRFSSGSLEVGDLITRLEAEIDRVYRALERQR